MMAPLPYCFSIWPRARLRARCFSSLLLLTVCCAMLSPTAYVAGCYLITNRSCVTLTPSLPPARGSRICCIICGLERRRRVMLQDHLQRLGYRAYSTEFQIQTA